MRICTAAGLSYTAFAYTELRVDTPLPARICTELNISVEVRNVGAVASDEVAMVFLSLAGTQSSAPRVGLAAFTRAINLAPGERRRLVFTVKPAAMAVFVDADRALVLQPCTLRLFVGGRQPSIDEVNAGAARSPGVLSTSTELTGPATPLGECLGIGEPK